MKFYSIVWLYAGCAAAAAMLLLFVWSASKRRRLLSKFASERLLPELSRTVSRTKIGLKNAMLIAGVFFIFAALSRPQWGYKWEEIKTKGIDIVFAIDTSKSMLAEDVKPNRLDRAKLAVLDIVNVLDGDRIGIVAFAGQSFLQCPLTLDYNAFRMSLEALDTDIIQRGGTNIAAAILEAESAFAHTSNKKIIVLISDGEELESSALTKAKEAAKDGVVIYTLGVGSVKGGRIPVRDEFGKTTYIKDEYGNPVTSKLDERMLSKVAAETGGFYKPLTANGMDAIYNEGLKKIPQQELSSKMKQTAIERFQIPLVVAIILLGLESLIGTRKFFTGRHIFMRALLIGNIGMASLLYLPDKLCAQPSNEGNPIPVESNADTLKTAREADQAGSSVNTAKSRTERHLDTDSKPGARDLFNKALEEMDSNKYIEAKNSFMEAMKLSPKDLDMHAKALYNMGNADYRLSEAAIVKSELPQILSQRARVVPNAASSTISNGLNLLKRGTELLKRESELLASAKNDQDKKLAMQKSPLKNRQFQQSLKQGITQCETIEKEFSDLKKSYAESEDIWKKSRNMLLQSRAMFDSALKLDNKLENAKNNLKSVDIALANLDGMMKKASGQLSELANNEANPKRVTFIKDELKKLIRDDNQQNANQNNQSNQNNQNRRQDRQDGQKNQKNENGQQNQQQQQEQNRDTQDRENKSGGKNADDTGGSKDRKNNSDTGETGKGEQAVAPKEQSDKNPADAEGGGKEEEDAVNPREQKFPTETAKSDKKSKNADKKPGEGTDEKAMEDYRRTTGTMTRGEARQLLESIQDSEKVLPMRGFGEQNNRFEKAYKDW